MTTLRRAARPDLCWGKTPTPALTRPPVNEVPCEALFASGLQRSDAATADAVAEAISCMVRRLGTRGCVSLMAQEFGDHPESAAERMRWVRQLVAELQQA